MNPCWPVLSTTWPSRWKNCSGCSYSPTSAAGRCRNGSAHLQIRSNR
ncbi:hypothetical protein KX928_22620 [Roseobacter sp. YSTF-M11]|uniref:Uncharacterized protein n=1 Tax=Roseobacter insulae TaxID=2859783 RepID=A0A9X1K5A3_9RHOB|nr:hypothetical protein [Roseobacter insulae]